MHVSKVFHLAGAVVLGCIVIGSGEAQAVTQSRSLITNPVGICQAALPAFEGQIRKRPLAVQNEGTSNAFVSCAFTSQSSPLRVSVYFGSTDGAAHAISCTGVTGFSQGVNQFVVKTIDLPASGMEQQMQWLPADFTGGSPNFPSARFSMSCNLAPGVGIYDSNVDFAEDVGT